MISVQTGEHFATHLPSHLISAGKFLEAYGLLIDEAFVDYKAAIAPNDLLADFSLLLAHGNLDFSQRTKIKHLMLGLY